jgi:hypothetical protein
MIAVSPAHEQEFIRAFIQKDKQERSAFLLSHPDRRRKLTTGLAHLKWLDERFARRIPPTEAHTAGELVALLRRKGAGSTVWVISEDSSIDGQEMPLADAIERVWGQCKGTILSCVPGKLCFFRGEEMRSERLLERP